MNPRRLGSNPDRNVRELLWETTPGYVKFQHLQGDGVGDLRKVFSHSSDLSDDMNDVFREEFSFLGDLCPSRLYVAV